MTVRSGTARKTLEFFRNRYAGQRAFILGNGPSLKKLDLTKLANEITFGVNGIFYLFDEMGFKPTFYCVEDKLFAEDRIQEVNEITGPTKIFGEYLRYCFDDAEDVIWANVRFEYREYPGFPHFSRNAAEHLWVGGTVAYLCMQLAYHMGFRDVYLIGFDHSYAIPDSAVVDGTEITSTSDDPNHFHPDYFGKGKRWHHPRLDRMERAYRQALRAFNADGRSICNATAGGKLEIFPRVSYASLFSQPSTKRTPTRVEPVLVVPASQPSENVPITAIVCTYRNPELLENTLRSLMKQTLAPDAFEVIVVDNNSDDSTPDVVARFPSVRYLLEPEQGLSAARNSGIRAARGEIIAFIDDDAEAAPSWLAELLEVYNRFPDVLAVGGKALPIWEAQPPNWLDESRHRTLSLVDWGEQVRPLQWPERIIGVNCSFRRSVFDQYGFFDTELGRLGASLLGSEDVELQKRIYGSGGLIYYTPDAVVHHHVPRTRMTRLYFQVRGLATRLDHAILEMRAQGIGAQIPQVLQPIRTQASAASGFASHAEAIVESLRRGLSVLQSTPGWEEFETATMGSPQERRSLRVHASEAVAQGDWAQAEKDLRALAHLMLISPEAYLPLIELLMLAGHVEEAAEEVELARVLDRGHLDLLRLRGIAFHQLRDLEGAREAFRQALERSPGDLETRLALGKAELDMRLYEQARRAYEAAVGADSNRAEAWLGLAQACAKLDDRQGFERGIEHVRALEPDHPELPRVLNGGSSDFGPELLAASNAPAPASPVRGQETRKARAAPLPRQPDPAPSQRRLRMSVVVCTYRNPELLEKTLQSLLAQTLDRGLYEVIAVDNNSNDRTSEVVSRYPSVRYVLETHQGLTCARNAGVLAARGDVIAFIDDDAEAEPGWLTALLEVYAEVPTALAVGGKAVPVWDAPPPEWLDRNYYRSLSLIDWGDEIRPLTWPERIIGVNCSFRCDVFSQIGAFDSALGRTGSFLLGSEDTEIQQRIHEAGYQVYYTPRAVVRHHVPAWRMTRTYLLERQLGNLLSLAITVLREEGRNRAIEEILSVLRSEAHPELIIPDLSKKIAVMGEAFRHALMALRATPRWSKFQANQLATPDEMQRMLRRVGEAIAQNDWSGAEGILRALVSRAPTSPVAYFPLIDILTIEERLDEARETIEFGLAVNPGDLVLLRHLGENRRRRGDMAGAMEALQHSLAGAPKEPATLIALGRLSAETGRREEALSYYRRAADFLPTEAECWIDIARGGQGLGERDLVEAALRHARELDPGREELTEFVHGWSALQPRNEVLSRSNERLERYRERHRGERCVIIGNGPSLKRMDLSFLRHEITFGLNRVYLLSNDLDFQPNYYVCMNPLVLEQSSREIQAIRAPRFLSAQCMHLFPDAEDTVFLQPMPGPDFALDPSRGVWEGYTVTYVALQLAYYMGFSEVVLIGVDHEYRYPAGRPNQEVVSTGDDPNHFHPQYFGAGVRWHLPDLTNAEVAYRLAHDRFRGDGRSVIDATVEGKLNIFPKRDYREIFLRDSAMQLDHESQQPQPALTAARSGSAYKVTAIVSTYAAERLLESCLEDLERQTIAAQTEIIVVDSGSPENEERIVREFQRRHTNLVYIRTCRETLYEAWNRGVAMARGEYLTNANTDDRHRADAFERMASEFDRREVGIVYADSLITTTENEVFEDHTADRTWKLPPFSVRQVLMDCPFGPQPMWRRVLHDDIGLFEGKYRLAGDYELFMRLAIEHDAYHLGEVLGLYYESRDNLSYNQNAMRAELDDFLARYRSTTPLERIYPFMERDRSDEVRIAAWLDFANHLIWMTPYPALEYAEEIYRKLIARTGERVEFLHNLALALLLQKRPDEGAPLLRDLAPRSEIAARNLRLLDAGQDVNPRDLEVATIAHPALQSLTPVIPAWRTRVPLGG